jgi:hypothetical protein
LEQARLSFAVAKTAGPLLEGQPRPGRGSSCSPTGAPGRPFLQIGRSPSP